MSSAILRCSLGDLDVESFFARLRDRGPGLAHLELEWPEAPAEGSSASLRYIREDGTVDELVGTVRRSRLLEGTETLRVTLVGGAGLLLAEIPARHHAAGDHPVPAGLVLADLVADTSPGDGASGEALAEGVEAALDAVALPRWTRAGGPAGEALDVLASVLGWGWRLLLEGTVWAGVETWPAVDGTSSHPIGGEPADGMVLYAPDGFTLLPGTTIDGMRAVEVCYRFGGAGDDQPAALVAEVRAAVSGDPLHVPALDVYRAAYPGKAVKQDDDGTLHIVCDDARIGDDLRSIPLRVGFPGCKVTVPEGWRCAVVFERADPRGAYAVGVDQDPDADAPFALKGDESDCGYLSAVGVAVGSPIVFVLSPTPTPNSIHITGKITGPCHAYALGKKAAS